MGNSKYTSAFATGLVALVLCLGQPAPAAPAAVTALMKRASMAETQGNNRDAVRLLEQALKMAAPTEHNLRADIACQLAVNSVRLKDVAATDRYVDMVVAAAGKEPAKRLEGDTILSIVNLADTLERERPWGKSSQEENVRVARQILKLADLTHADEDAVLKHKLSIMRIFLAIGKSATARQLLLEQCGRSYSSAGLERLRLHLAALDIVTQGKQKEFDALHKADEARNGVFIAAKKAAVALFWACAYNDDVRIINAAVKKLSAPPVTPEKKFQIFELRSYSVAAYGDRGMPDAMIKERILQVAALDNVPQYAGDQRRALEKLTGEMRRQGQKKELKAIMAKYKLPEVESGEGWLTEFEKDHLFKDHK